MTSKNVFKVGLVALVALVSFAFTSIINKEVNIKSSTVKWKGYKITGEHYGTINLKKGLLSFEGDILVGGEFVMDMSSIKTEDMDAEYNAKLDGHLKHDDFFGVDKHPTAKLKFTKVQGHGNHYHIVADLTIKGITKPVKFDLNVSNKTATTKVVINRTHYGIKYGSASFFDDLKDKAIKDEFDLDVTLKF